MCTWGWWVSAEPQLCSTAVMPMRAPRCRGSAAIGGDRHHRLRGRLEQQGVENGLVLERDVGDPRRQGEDDMEIPDRQQIGLTFGQPCPCGVPLTARTMTVAATVIGDPPVSTVPARCDMTTKGCGATVFDCRHC